MKRCAVLLLVVACGPGSNTTTIGGGDAGSGSGGSGSGSVNEVTCQTHTRSVVAAYGSRTVTDTKFAIVDGVDPSSDFVIESCDLTLNGTPLGTAADPPCPSGSTCSSSGAPFVTGAHVCIWDKIGSFVDSHLVVSCGSTTTVFNSSGMMTSQTVEAYGAIRVHH